MIYDLFDELLYTPDTGGCWYLTAASGYDGNMQISDDNITFYNTTLAVNDKIQNLPNVSAVHTIYVDLTSEDFDQLEFTYVVGCQASDTFSEALCETCSDCATVTITKVDEGEDVYLNVDTQLLNENTTKANFEFTLTSYLLPKALLSNGDKVKFKCDELGVNVDWIVGQNPMSIFGFTNDFGSTKWLTFRQYWNCVLDMTPSRLLTGTFKIRFDKRKWAFDNNAYNEYDDDGVLIENNAEEFDFTFQTRHSGLYSSIETETIEKIKINCFEDTSDEGYTIKPMGVGTWENLDAADITENCDADCLPSANLLSWFSEKVGDPCTGGLTVPPSTIIEYQVEANPAETVALTFTDEESFVDELNIELDYSFRYLYCNINTLGEHNVRGYNATFLVSRYMLESEDDLTYFIIRYDNETANDGKTIKMTLDQPILF